MNPAVFSPSISRTGLVVALLLAPWSRANAADEPFSTTRMVLDSQQIDRFEAINRLQQSLGRNPDDPTDWIILGELAQEVAFDVPSSQTGSYLAIARNAYAQALNLRPDDPGLRAALRVVRDQQEQLDTWHQDRDRLVSTYLDARRRELNQPGATPMLRDSTDRRRPPSAPLSASRELNQPRTLDPSADPIDLDPDASPRPPVASVDVDVIEPVVYDEFYTPPPRPALASPQSAIDPRALRAIPGVLNRPADRPPAQAPLPRSRIDPTDRPAPSLPRSLSGPSSRLDPPEPIPVPGDPVPLLPEPAVPTPEPGTVGAAPVPAPSRLPEPVGTMPTTAPPAPEAFNPPPIAPSARP